MIGIVKEILWQIETWRRARIRKKFSPLYCYQAIIVYAAPNGEIPPAWLIAEFEWEHRRRWA